MHISIHKIYRINIHIILKDEKHMIPVSKHKKLASAYFGSFAVFVLVYYFHIAYVNEYNTDFFILDAIVQFWVNQVSVSMPKDNRAGLDYLGKNISEKERFNYESR